MAAQKTDQVLRKKPLQTINGLRSLNAFVGMFSSAWSIGFLLTSFILGAILAYFGVLFTFPLWSICLIAGGIALALGVWTARSRYDYLEVREEYFEFHSLEEANKNFEEQLSDKKSGVERLLFWEKVNTFIADSQKIFSLAGMIILVVSGVFGLTPHPAALLIAAIAAIAYGIFSSTVRGSQVSYRLERSHLLQVEFEKGEAVAKSHKVTAETDLHNANIKVKHYEQMRTELEKLPEGEQLSERNKAYLSAAEKELPNLFNEKLSILTNQQAVDQLGGCIDQLNLRRAQCGTNQQKVSSLAGQITALKLDAHLGFTDRDKWRVGYHLCVGGFGGGSFAYIALEVFHIFAVSTPVLCAIIAAVAVVYGISSAYFKIESIRREKWLTMDYETVKKRHGELNQLLEKVNNPELANTIINKKEDLPNPDPTTVYPSPIKSKAIAGVPTIVTSEELHSLRF